ncbi:DUF7507 domain-containing protein, partial [Jannaschia pohangensis]
MSGIGQAIKAGFRKSTFTAMAALALTFAGIGAADAQAIDYTSINTGAGGTNLNGSTNTGGANSTANPAAIPNVGVLPVGTPFEQLAPFTFVADPNDTDPAANPLWGSGISFPAGPARIQAQGTNTDQPSGRSIDYVFDWDVPVWGVEIRMDFLDNDDTTFVSASRNGVPVPLLASYIVSTGASFDTLAAGGVLRIRNVGDGGDESFSLQLPLDVVIDTLTFGETGKLPAAGGPNNGPVTVAWDNVAVARPDIGIVKTSSLDVGADGRPSVGDVITYTFTARNTGRVVLSDVQVNDPDATAITLVSGNPANMAPGADIVWTGTYTLQPADLAAGEVINSATVSGQPAGTTDPADRVNDVSDSGNPADDDGIGQFSDEPTVNDETPTVTPIERADLVTVKSLVSADSPLLAGPDANDDVVMQIVVTNNGPDDATNVMLTDPTPTGFTLDSFSITGDATGGTSFTGGVLTLGALAVGDSATLTLNYSTQAGTEGQTLTNTVTERAVSDQVDPTTAGDDLTESVTVAGVPVAVNDSQDNLTVGDVATVPVTVNDSGNNGFPGGALDPDSVRLVDAGGAPVTQLVVPGEGTWDALPGGEIRFTPEPGFTGDPTPVTYTVADLNGSRSNPATVTLDYVAPPVAV